MKDQGRGAGRPPPAEADAGGAQPSEGPAEPANDLLFVHGPSERGNGWNVIRKRNDALELGELRTMREGRAIHGDVVKLTPRPEHERLFEVETVVKARPEGPREPPGKGPAQVATDAYRASWDRIFGALPPLREPGDAS